MDADLQYLLTVIRRYRLENRSKTVRRLLPALERGLIRNNMAKALLVQVQPMVAEMERRPNHLFRAPEGEELYPKGVPPLILGQLEEAPNVPLGLFPKGAFHCLFEGTTEAGKTVALRQLVTAIEKLNRRRAQPIVVIILDYKGRSFADFPARFGAHWHYYIVGGALRLGLQSPVGVGSTVWINHVATSLCARAGLISGWVTLANVMRWLVAAMNPKPTVNPLFPDFQLILDVLEDLPKTVFAEKEHYRDSVTQVLEGITQASGELFRTFRGLDLEEDLIGKGHSAVISVPDLSPPWLNQFVADLLVLHLLLGRIGRGHRVNDPDVILVLDDADDIVSKDNERLFATSMPPIVRGLRQFREFGVGVCLGIGALNPVSEHILNSIKHHFVFRNPHDNCVDIAKRTLGLPGGSQGIIQTLRPGECVARLSGDWPHAFLAEIDNESAS